MINQVDTVFSHTERQSPAMMWLRMAVVWQCPPSPCSFHFLTLVGTWLSIAVQHTNFFTHIPLHSTYNVKYTALKNQFDSLQLMSTDSEYIALVQNYRTATSHSVHLVVSCCLEHAGSVQNSWKGT